MAGAAVGKPARCHSFPVPRPTLGTQTSYARYREALCHAINGEGDINVDCTFVLSVTKHRHCPVKGLYGKAEPMTCQETGGLRCLTEPVKWHTILGYELWRESPEATEFRGQSHFFYQRCHRVGGERVGMHIRD
jgi:hypothetical protein